MPKKYYTIKEVFKLIERLETKSNRMPELLGFRSMDICKSFKQLISLTNSLAIVFLQYSLIPQALKLLKKAASADLSLQRYGSLMDRFWQGRMVTYNNLAWMYLK